MRVVITVSHLPINHLRPCCLYSRVGRKTSSGSNLGVNAHTVRKVGQNTTDPPFESLIAYLKDARGFDFTGYKRSTLVRRIGRRRERALFNIILINVTGFFRDTQAWEYLRTSVLDQLFATKAAGAPIRVWSAGCATGEEAYSLAILLAEMLGREAFQQRVKIYATDVDEDALSYARQSAYSEREVRSLDPAHLAKYFETGGNRAPHQPPRAPGSRAHRVYAVDRRVRAT
jgi:chemotaxis methyl-accepting protein methylase